MLDEWNIVVCFDKDWIATSGINMFIDKPLSYVMTWVNDQMDVDQYTFKMEVIQISDGYRVVFTFIS